MTRTPVRGAEQTEVRFCEPPARLTGDEALPQTLRAERSVGAGAPAIAAARRSISGVTCRPFATCARTPGPARSDLSPPPPWPRSARAMLRAARAGLWIRRREAPARSGGDSGRSSGTPGAPRGDQPLYAGEREETSLLITHASWLAMPSSSDVIGLQPTSA